MAGTRKKSIKSTKCIFVLPREGEGLGNQLFMYAAGLTVQKNLNLPICITTTEGNPHSRRDYRKLLNAIPADTNKNTKKRINTSQNAINKDRYFTNGWSIQNALNSNKNIKVPENLYQNYKSIAHVIPIVKEILMKNEFNQKKYDKFRKMIQKGSAFMHVRRGDKISLGRILSPEYYTVALKLLSQNTTINKIYILSDDIQWCKENDSLWKGSTNIPIEYFYNKDELITLYVMSLCHAGAITSSSTFSAWGAMLGADMNPSSTIVHKNIPIDYGTRVNPFEFPERWNGI
jgi:hypothetical protein